MPSPQPQNHAHDRPLSNASVANITPVILSTSPFDTPASQPATDGRCFFVTLPQETISFITDYLRSKDLTRLARTCRALHHTPIRTMYRRDARCNGSRAVFLAITGRRLPHDLGESIVIVTLGLAKRYGADLNARHSYLIKNSWVEHTVDPPLPGAAAADLWVETRQMTPIAIAAAEGRLKIVKWLRHAGADPSLADTGGPLFAPTLLNKVGSALGLHTELHPSHLSPLMLPLLSHKHDIVFWLLINGASATLATQPGRLAVELLHLAAARKDIMGGEKDTHIIRRYREDINAPMFLHGRGGKTPLCVAVQNKNIAFAHKLLKAGANPNIPDERGLSPLISLIRESQMKACAAQRRDEIELIKALITHGADVNFQSDPGSALSPLTAAVTPTEWKPTTVWRDMKNIIEILVDGGARINDKTSDQQTVMHYLCNMIRSKNENQSMINIAEYLIKHGGDVNIPFPDDSSILGRIVTQPEKKPWKLLKTLREAKAHIQPQEARMVLEVWAENSKIRSSVDVAGFKAYVTENIFALVLADFQSITNTRKSNRILDALDEYTDLTGGSGNR